jgi:hypothetical protein
MEILENEDNKVMEFKRKCQKLLNENKILEFLESYYGKNYIDHIYDEEEYKFISQECKNWTEEEHQILMKTSIIYDKHFWYIGALLAYLENKMLNDIEDDKRAHIRRLILSVFDKKDKKFF